MQFSLHGEQTFERLDRTVRPYRHVHIRYPQPTGGLSVVYRVAPSQNARLPSRLFMTGEKRCCANASDWASPRGLASGRRAAIDISAGKINATSHISPEELQTLRPSLSGALARNQTGVQALWEGDEPTGVALPSKVCDMLSQQRYQEQDVLW